MKVIPQKDNILVRRDAATETTRGGLFLPQASRELPAEGTVVRRGPGRMMDTATGGYLQQMTVHPGDRVMFQRGVGVEVESDGEKLLLMSEGAVIATLTESVVEVAPA